MNKEKLKQKSMQICRDIIQYHQQYGKYPTDTSNTQWLNTKRRIKAGIHNGRGIFYPELQQMANQANLPDMFTNQVYKNKDVQNCNLVIDYVDDNNKYPACRGKLAYLGKWLSNKRLAKKDMGEYAFHEELQHMAEEAGLPNMFNQNWKDDLD